MTEGVKTKGLRGPKNSKVLIIVLTVALVAAVAGGVFIYLKYNDLKNNPASQQSAADNQAKALKEKVSKLISVPDETPIVATVTDKDKLKDQPFFADAQNGDYILMFASAKKAYIYRESENKLINVGPIAIASDTTDGTTTTNK